MCRAELAMAAGMRQMGFQPTARSAIGTSLRRANGPTFRQPSVSPALRPGHGGVINAFGTDSRVVDAGDGGGVLSVSVDKRQGLSTLQSRSKVPLVSPFFWVF